MRPSRTATCVASGRDGFIVMILRAWKMVMLMRGLGHGRRQYGPQRSSDWRLVAIDGQAVAWAHVEAL